MRPASSSLAAHALFAGDALRTLAQFGEPQLRLLRTFVAVVQAGGFSAAAAELQVDLSTVSKQFRELEAWLGCPLAQRGRGGFRLKPEGERLHTLALQLLAAIGHFSDGASTLGRPAPPLLRLGLVDALLGNPGWPGLPALMARCTQALPGLQWQLSTLRPQDIERQLLAGQLDAGVLARRPPASGLEQHRLCSEASSLYVAPGHPWHADPLRPRSPAELASAAWVSDPYLDSLPPPSLSALPPGSGTHADSIEGVALLVATGHFAGFLPDHLVHSQPALAPLRAVQPDRFAHTQELVLCCRQGKASPALRGLLRVVAGTDAKA